MESIDEPAIPEASTSADVRHDENASLKEDDELWEDVNDNANCLLCDKFMGPSNSRVVKERGINNLIVASIKRKDGKHLKLRKSQEITVHKTCQSMYTRESNVKIALKASAETWRNNRKRRSDGREFDFSTTCVFCSNRLFKTESCVRVTSQLTIDNAIAQLEVYPKTEINKMISSRLCQFRTKDDNYYTDNNVSYHRKCMSQFYLFSPTNIRGRPISESISHLSSFIINYILENSDECQFSLKEILEKYKSLHGQTEIPRLDRIEQLLKQHFGDEIAIHSSTKDRFICFKQSLSKCVEENWYSNRKNNKEEEKYRIVDLAAHIILQDIRAMKFDIENYPSPTDFVNNVSKDIPQTLQLFLDISIKTHKHTPKSVSWAKWDNRIVAAVHILMTSVRPRPFQSSVLLGLSCMMHTKFAARGLIDSLYNIGLCASYSETVRFESSIANHPEKFDLTTDAYLQFVYDNADHNTGTIGGKNTFHCMGGIMCVTPSTSVSLSSSIPRLKGALPASTSGTYGFLPLTDFKNKKPFKLDSVIVRNWKEADGIDFNVQIEPIDVLYFYGKHTAPQKTANWHGFMNQYHNSNTDFSTTRVIALPFIRAPPSDHTTILTFLIDARHRADDNHQTHCFVTFDLPLYMKASEIVASIDPDNDPHNLRSVVPRLGGFHLLISFLDSIGNIMAGSNLKEAFCTIYADLSADKALTGHAFSRSVRAHLLMQAALATKICEQITFTDTEKAHLSKSLEKVGDDPVMKDMQGKFVSVIDDIEKSGPTSQLWVQYFKMICLIQRYIDAERSGNFHLHLETVQLMIPFFCASGHHLYAKACLLYVQQMLNLKNIMDIVEYDTFCTQGFYTIRRSHRFSCGVWSDMTIEQVLMRAIKCIGGLTHGRGLTENVIGKWVTSRVAVLEISNAMEIFCNRSFTTSEQHVDNRVSRMCRDADDLAKVQQFFTTYNPFPETDKLIGIYSGVNGDLGTVNCHKAFEIGKVCMGDTSNKKFTDVKYKRNTKVVHLAAGSSTMRNVANEEVHISPLLLFQRILLQIQSQDDMKEYSCHELSPIPLAILDEHGMPRKNTKSVFYCNFNCSNDIITRGTITHVVAGGFFLHKVVWQSNIKIDEIVRDYVSYARRHFAPNSWIIFDGYPEDETLSTKSVERSRRQSKNIGRDIAFDKNTTIAVNQKQFLSNERNKSKLIDAICTSLNAAGFRTKIAPEDADRLIVVTAIENAVVDSEGTVIFVGQDVDLLVIFTQLAENINNLYFRKDNASSKPDEFYASNSFKYASLQTVVAFLHAFCGCDTTSSFYRIGKNKIIDSFPHDRLVELASVFYDRSASREQITRNACELIVGIYSNKAEKKLIEKSSSFSVSDLRYLHFSKVKVKSKFSIETLPPTEGAAKQHAFRVFYQLQLWLGNTNLEVTEWGWQVRQKQLMPIGSTDPPIPQKLLAQILCSCSKKGCIDGSCSCKKHGLRCTNLCAHCHENTCQNLDNIYHPIESENEEDDVVSEIAIFGNIETSDKDIDEIEFARPAKRPRIV